MAAGLYADLGDEFSDYPDVIGNVSFYRGCDANLECVADTLFGHCRNPRRA
jgi:hypothetical protein